MLRELSVSMIGTVQQQGTPALTNGPLQHSNNSLSREDSEEIEFECKLDQGLPGNCMQACIVGGGCGLVNVVFSYSGYFSLSNLQHAFLLWKLKVFNDMQQ